jgi:hypothetical protein
MITSIVCIGSAGAQSTSAQSDQKTTEKPAATPPAPAVSPAAVADSAAVDPVVDKILTRLEQREVKDLRAGVLWETGDMLDPDDVIKKKGEILFRQEDPVAKFKVHFTKKIVDKKAPDIDEQHLFDGHNYTILDAANKRIERREIRAPDDRRNPYKVGEGAFPLPFGQKKADILREFDVALAPASPKDPPETDHLRLTPRKGTSSERQYRAIEFWVRRDGGDEAGLPVKVRTIQRGAAKGEESFVNVTFSDVKLNTGLGVAPFTIEEPDGYEVQFIPLGYEPEKAGKNGTKTPVP